MGNFMGGSAVKIYGWETYLEIWGRHGRVYADIEIHTKPILNSNIVSFEKISSKYFALIKVLFDTTSSVFEDVWEIEIVILFYFSYYVFYLKDFKVNII